MYHRNFSFLHSDPFPLPVRYMSWRHTGLSMQVQLSNAHSKWKVYTAPLSTLWSQRFYPRPWCRLLPQTCWILSLGPLTSFDSLSPDSLSVATLLHPSAEICVNTDSRFHVTPLSPWACSRVSAWDTPLALLSHTVDSPRVHQAS